MKNIIKIFAAVLFILTGCSQVQPTLNENITQPILKNEPKLLYPISAQENNFEGTTTVVFIITKEGSVNQTRIQKSSGFKELDFAAENFCKSLEFIPAKENETSISSTMKWDVKFNLENLSIAINRKITKVKDLYSAIEKSVGKDKQNLQKEILSVHDNVVNKMKDGLKMNEYIYLVVKPSIKNEWESLTRNYPLTFLLYHDFINRFEDFDSLNTVKLKMKMALKQDLQFLNQSYSFANVDNANNAIIIQKIKRFLELNYPDMNLHDLDLKIGKENNNLS